MRFFIPVYIANHSELSYKKNKIMSKNSNILPFSCSCHIVNIRYVYHMYTSAILLAYLNKTEKIKVEIGLYTGRWKLLQITTVIVSSYVLNANLPFTDTRCFYGNQSKRYPINTLKDLSFI